MTARGLVLTLALIGAFAVSVGSSGPALASCMPPDVDEQIARAEVIVYGTVTETRQTFAPASPVIRFRPVRLLKGSLTREVEVYLGPTHGGGPTSVDYMAAVTGEGHTLYLRAAGDGAYETDACSGSHPGTPNAAEERRLGPGTAVDVAEERGLSGSLAILVGLATVISVGALLWALRRPAAA